MTDIVQATIGLVQSHRDWAAPIVFALALCQVLCIYFAGGAGNGDCIRRRRPDRSGRNRILVNLAGRSSRRNRRRLARLRACDKVRRQIVRMWPLSRDPAMVNRGMAFFQRWGMFSVFIGQFFGPLRAVVPIAAGLCQMPRLKFQLSNVASALVWATGILAPGAMGVGWLMGRSVFGFSAEVVGRGCLKPFPAVTDMAKRAGPPRP